MIHWTARIIPGRNSAILLSTVILLNFARDNIVPAAISVALGVKGTHGKSRRRINWKAREQIDLGEMRGIKRDIRGCRSGVKLIKRIGGSV